ncbi:MAG: hypothetical protein QF535_07100, partial [Anaerolineales bacterium]|nr:hypothetical protein [Anaerolineales bacterium]
ATGLIKIEDDTDQSVAAEAVSTTANRTYGLQLNSSDQGVVNVPWTDTTYTAGDFKLDDLDSPDDNTDLDFSTSAHGLVPKGTNTGNFLKDDGTWAAAGTALTTDIVFSAAGKGICLGVTTNTDANTLDDYEEGTWTPMITDLTNDATMNASFGGSYTKIGRIVIVSGIIGTTSLGSVSGAISISGLPFAVAAGWNSMGAIAVSTGGGLAITAGQMVGLKPTGGSATAPLALWDLTVGSSDMYDIEWTDDGSITIGGTYLAA